MGWIAPVASAIIGYLGSRQAAKAGRPAATENEIQNQLLANLKSGSSYLPFFLDTARQNIGGASDFAGSLMRGGYQNQLSMLGPELGANSRANLGLFNSGLRYLPRGSGTGTERLGLADNLSTNLNNGLLSMRPNAASMMQGLGTASGGLAGSLMSGGNQGGLGLLGLGLQNRTSSFDMSRAAMQGILQALGGFSSGGGSGTQSPQTLPQGNLDWLNNNPSLLTPGGLG
jgi:hypothetical protein